jgi:site-specific DNA-methyltransferase (adenine-specific)
MNNINFYNIDCMEFMQSIPDKHYDLAIVDPPYGIGENGSKNQTRGKLAKSKNYKSFAGDDISPPTKDFFLNLNRISKNVIIFGANHFIQNIPNANSSYWIVWDKVNGDTDFADSELAYTTFKTAVRNFKFQWQGMLQGNMKNKEIRIHPTQKPVALYRWILQKYAKQGNKILDTHGGSGSIAIACELEGYDLDLCELDTDYFKKLKQRYEDHCKQPRLF